MDTAKSQDTKGVQNTCQIIDEKKEFHDVSLYFKDQQVINNGYDYHVVAVFGSQSTGKSTLLNALFGTTFGVMDEVRRAQTTKGIWLARALSAVEDTDVCSSSSSDSLVNISTGALSNIVVLDVEGTDGRERGEDQEFERKSALFALATSEILMVNMWENQVGLYQGANMGLLKTVFEVNLSLFADTHKRSLILFVIRDHIGATPLSSLAATLTADLEKHWQTIAKPESMANSKISDFFDVEFRALPHKLLLPDDFKQKVSDLQLEFPKLFKNEYHRKIPIDGWNIYASQIWKLIDENKDLDLPSQQDLVARFRCDEIVTESMALLETAKATIEESTPALGGERIIPNLGAHLKALHAVAVENFDKTASRYSRTVYQEHRGKLIAQLNSILIDNYYLAQLRALKEAAIAKFQLELQTQSSDHNNSLKSRMEKSERDATDYFAKHALDDSLGDDESMRLFKSEQTSLVKELNTSSVSLKNKELSRLSARVSKKIADGLNDILVKEFSAPNAESWDKIFKRFKEIEQSEVSSKEDEFRYLGGFESVQRSIWIAFDGKLKEMLREDTVATRMRDIFEGKFKYKNNVPVVFNGRDDIEKPFLIAKEETLAVLPIYAKAKLSNGTPIKPEVSLSDADEVEIDFEERLTLPAIENISERFNRQADQIFVDTKRSATQTMSHIPPWLILLIVFLGWNEFLAVLRNPLLLLFAVLAASGAFFYFNVPGVAQATALIMNRLSHIGGEIVGKQFGDLFKFPEGMEKIPVPGTIGAQR